MGTEGPFPGGKAAGTWSWPLVPRSRIHGSRHLLPHMPSWRSSCLHKYRDNFTFYMLILSFLLHLNLLSVCSHRVTGLSIVAFFMLQGLLTALFHCRAFSSNLSS
jgi:hypothetical protein